jgi:hypothetical protein
MAKCVYLWLRSVRFLQRILGSLVGAWGMTCVSARAAATASMSPSLSAVGF